MPGLKSLPTTLTTEALDTLLKAFPKSAVIDRRTDNAVVKAPNGDKVLSAVEVSKNVWHVMAVPGLIDIKKS